MPLLPPLLLQVGQSDLVLECVGLLPPGSLLQLHLPSVLLQQSGQSRGPELGQQLSFLSPGLQLGN